MGKLMARKAIEMYEIFDSSEQLKNSGGKKSVYPWHTIPIGKSFTVHKKRITMGALRTLASKTSKRLGKKFRVIEHDNVYEVGRLPDDDKTQLENKGFKI